MEPISAAPAPVARLIDEFHKLPGIGPKSAQRLTYHMLRIPYDDAVALAQAIIDLKDRTVLCSVCQNVTESDPCAICGDQNRERSAICVVEEPLDILAVERTRGFHGLYHVLHGVISPMDGIGPDDLKIGELLGRVRSGTVTEVIMATNPNLEGEATATYLSRLLHTLEITVSRLASGLPVGGDLEYADEVTLGRAFEGRRTL